MTALPATPAQPAAEPTAVPLHDRAAAEAYVASVCFKHGPPQRIGAELEWTVHYAGRPRRPLRLPDLIAALAAHAPTSANPTSPHLPLGHGCLVTLEPGGQVEISAPPQRSLTTLLATIAADAAELAALLAARGLELGRTALDPYRPPHRLLANPRYAAMEAVFAPIGPDGLAWMCASAGLQVCLDVGEPHRAAARWAASHALGPVLAALFANSDPPGGPRRCWSSARLRTMFGADPGRNRPAAVTEDPAASWARRALDTPLLCVRRPGSDWAVPGRITFAEWISGAAKAVLPGTPTTDDLDYHLTTLFPPVRPRGYLEVRYLDSQPDGTWIAPVVLLAALFADEARVDAALAAARPAAGRWLHAARYGLADPPIARAAAAVVELAAGALPGGTDLDTNRATAVLNLLEERLAKPQGERT